MEKYFDKRYVAEFVGTLALVLIGCAAITISNFPVAFPIGILAIGLAFGLTYTAVAYGVGSLSGAHFNPAVTVAVFVAGRMKKEDVIPYVIAQCLGAIVGAALLLAILKGRAQGYNVGTQGLGHTGWGTYAIWAVIIAEFVATLLFSLLFLGVTGPRGAAAIAGLIIGLTLAALHLAFINVSGSSLNPARSLGPAVFVGGNALMQVWLYLIVPTLGGAAAGWLVKSKTLDA
jgi:aquaporin Z